MSNRITVISSWRSRINAQPQRLLVGGDPNKGMTAAQGAFKPGADGSGLMGFFRRAGWWEPIVFRAFRGELPVGVSLFKTAKPAPLAPQGCGGWEG